MTAYAIAAVPTLYAGIQFRSRLEAKWAAFFDEVRWYWTYEPFDCDGWLPDFALSSRDRDGKAVRPVLVEVKPVQAFPEDVAEKIDRADRDHEVLIVGLGLLGDPGLPGHTVLGWLRDEHGVWAPAPLGCWKGSESEAKNPDGLVGFCHGLNSWDDRITGCYDGGVLGGEVRLGMGRIRDAWGHASNVVQWKKPRTEFSVGAERLAAGLRRMQEDPEGFHRSALGLPPVGDA